MADHPLPDWIERTDDGIRADLLRPPQWMLAALLPFLALPWLLLDGTFSSTLVLIPLLLLVASLRQCRLSTARRTRYPLKERPRTSSGRLVSQGASMPTWRPEKVPQQPLFALLISVCDPSTGLCF